MRCVGRDHKCIGMDLISESDENGYLFGRCLH